MNEPPFLRYHQQHFYFWPEDYNYINPFVEKWIVHFSTSQFQENWSYHQQLLKNNQCTNFSSFSTNPSLCKLILASVLWRNQEFLNVIFELKSALCIIISREAILKYFILLCCIDEGVLQYCMCSFAKIQPPLLQKTKCTHSDLLRILVNKFKIKIVWLMRPLCSVNFHFETVFSFKLTHLDWKHIASWCCFAISKHKNHISWVSSSQWLDCIILLKFHQIPLKHMISLQWPGSIVEFKVDL